MAVVYSATVEDLEECELDGGALSAIGRLVRAFAEIEHIIELYIGAACALNPSQIVVLLGKSPISKKLEIAEYFARMAGEDEHARFKSVFNSSFTEALACRNAVAHGVLLGKDKDGLYHFVTNNKDIPAESAAVQLVPAYHVLFLMNVAAGAEAAIKFAEERLRLSASRQRFRQQPLRPHRKAQPRKGEKQKRPPQS